MRLSENVYFNDPVGGIFEKAENSPLPIQCPWAGWSPAHNYVNDTENSPTLRTIKRRGARCLHAGIPPNRLPAIRRRIPNPIA